MDHIDNFEPDVSSKPILEDILEFEPNINNLSVSDINIPEKININIDSHHELPSLEYLLNDNLMQSEATESTNKNLSTEEMKKIMSDIENTVNFTNVEEGFAALNNPTVIFTRLQNAFNTFKEKTGRNMTYSEMRYMMG